MSARAKTPRKRTPPPPPCLCEECKRETCHGIGKPLEFGGLDLDPVALRLEFGADSKPFDLPDSFGELSLELGKLGTFGDDTGPAPAAARLAIARAIIRNAAAGVKIPPRVVKMARAEVERLS